MPDVLTLEFTDPSGDALRVEWAHDALAALDPGPAAQKPVWRLGGEVDWDEIETLRIVSGRLEDDRLVAIAALRPAGSSGHGDEIIAGGLADDEGFDRLAEVLVSTELGADGLPARIGLELYREDGGLPMRVAGDATATATASDGGVHRRSTALALRASGTGGTGVLDVLSRG